ncbi:hypothetical protein [Pseudomonas putida]|uniref:Uncharacterized protein n=1 Tax=Pseudomonas putida TaxID=303 RepID=A0A8I1ECS2_PSEPU|nr:hypothetical protein [Pseudomonas putida]MBI6883276.1 hypothetical protein [Pseudomonas putida]
MTESYKEEHSQILDGQLRKSLIKCSSSSAVAGALLLFLVSYGSESIDAISVAYTWAWNALLSFDLLWGLLELIGNSFIIHVVTACCYLTAFCFWCKIAHEVTHLKIFKKMHSAIILTFLISLFVLICGLRHQSGAIHTADSFMTVLLVMSFLVVTGHKRHLEKPSED